MDFSKGWPWLAGVAVCALVPIGIAAYAFGSGTYTLSLAVASIISLSAGLVLSLFFSMSAARDVQASQSMSNKERGRLLNDVNTALRQNQELREQTEALAEEVAAYREETTAASVSIAQGFAELKESHNAISESLRGLLDRPMQPPVPAAIYIPPQPEPALPREPIFMKWLNADSGAAVSGHEQADALPEPTIAPVPSEDSTSDDAVPFGDALNLAMEPVIDLYTSQTAHYRMVLGMINDAGQEVSHDMFVHYADRTNARPALDVFVAGEALAILAQLRKRDPKLSVFIPVGAATLASPDSIYKILEMLKQAPDLASGLVIDISHAVLASLPEASLEGLAQLARAGVVLSLSNAAISGVDLAALGKLNVKFVGLTAANLGLVGRLPPELAGFVQTARALRIQVIISQVADPRLVENLGRISRYACGAAFAAPRRLRRNGQPTLRAVA